MQNLRDICVRILFVSVMLWAQLAFSDHDLSVLDASHAHSADCVVCFLDHNTSGAVESVASVSLSLLARESLRRAEPHLFAFSTVAPAIRAPPHSC